MEVRTRDNGRHHHRELVVGGEAVSELVVVDYRMRLLEAEVRMAGIGGVHTRPRHRMRGYMRALMEDALDYMKEQGYDVSMLFGIPNFYERFGYVSCLAEYRITVSTREAERGGARLPGYSTARLRRSDFAELVALYNQSNRRRSCSAIRDERLFTRFPKGSRYNQEADAFAVRDSDGRLAAYAAYDRSEDALNVVEVESQGAACYPFLLYRFARMAIGRRCGQITFFLPPDHSFVEFLRLRGCEVVARYPTSGGGMMRVINQDSLFAKLQGSFRDRLGCSQLRDEGLKLEFTTDLGTTQVVLGAAGEGRAGGGRTYRLQMPQQRLMQLLVGYGGVDGLLGEADVQAPAGAALVLKALFAGPHAYLYQADRF